MPRASLVAAHLMREIEPPSSVPLAEIPPAPRHGLAAWLPGYWVARHYERRWIARDVAAGLVLTTLLVPAGMAYAEAAGLPAITGLYATVAALLAYAIVGPSRIMVLGPDSALAALIGAAIVERAGGDEARAIALAAILAIGTGVICVVAGLLRAGFLTELLSKPVRVGYMNGIAMTVLVNQLPKLFGFAVGSSGVLRGVLDFARGIIAGRTLPLALAIGGGSLLVILLSRRFAPRVPGVLIAVVGATVLVAALGLASRIPVVGVVPRGVPVPRIPSLHVDDLGEVLVASLGIALLSFADTSVLSRTMAGRGRYRVDPSRELVGLGIANLAAGLFGGFPVSSSASRTPVAESAGSQTQLTGVVGALAIVVLLVGAPWLVADLPTTALAAVVIAAALHLFDLRSVALFYRVRRSDFALSLLTFLAVAGLGVIAGIGVAVAVSILDFVRRAWRPHDAVLGRADGVTGYHDVERYPAARQIAGLLLFRWDAPLFFANADTFRERILERVDGARDVVRWVVVAAEPITDVDTTAAEMLEELDRELATRGAELAFAEMKDPVKDRLERYGLHKKIGRDFFFPTVGVAVIAYRKRYPDTPLDAHEPSPSAGE